MSDHLTGFLNRNKKKASFQEQIEQAKKGEWQPEGATSSGLQKAMMSAPVAREINVKNILLKDIYVEKQVREVDQEKVLEYASTIRGSETKQPIQPIVVWANPNGTYLIIVGEHRFRAQEHNYAEYGDDYDHITAVVKTGECPQGSDRRRIQMQENLQHNPMSDIEIALVVREEMKAGTFDTAEGAVKWLHVDGANMDKAPSTMMKTLYQVFSLLDDPEAIDLVEAIHKGEMKPYKAKQIHAQRIKERKQQELEARAAEVVSIDVKKANKRIAELQAELEQSRAAVAQVEAAEGDGDQLPEGAEIVDADTFLQSEKERQIDIEEQIARERAKSEAANAAIELEKAEPKKPKVLRFTLDSEQATTILLLLEELAATSDSLERIVYEGVNRSVWDNVLKERLPELESVFLRLRGK